MFRWPSSEPSNEVVAEERWWLAITEVGADASREGTAAIETSSQQQNPEYYDFAG